MPNTPDDVEPGDESSHLDDQPDPDGPFHHPDLSTTDLPTPTAEGWRSVQKVGDVLFPKPTAEEVDEESSERRRGATAEQDDAVDQLEADNTPWDTGTGVKITLPDGTEVEAPGDDFEDVETGELRPGRDTIRRALTIGGVLGALGFVAALILLFNGGDTDIGTLDTTAATTQGTEPTDPKDVEESQEPLSGVEAPNTGVFVAALIDCPSGYQQDATGRRPSPRPGQDTEEVAEIAVVTDTDRAFNLQCGKFGFGSYVFTMMVEGDAETAFVTDGTTFDLRFVVNSTWPENAFEDDTGFTTFITWNRQAGVYLGRVNDSTNTPVQGATVDIEWLDPSTLEATVTLPGDDIEVRTVRTELSGLTQDSQERTTAQYFDVAIWVAEE